MDSNLATDIFQICRTCTKEITSVSPFYLNYSPTHTDVTIIRKLNNCIPELDLNIVSKAVVCSKCADAIKFFYEFKQKCLELEIQINKYIHQVQHTGDLNLVEVVRFHQPPNKEPYINVKMEDIEIMKEFKNEDVKIEDVGTTKDFKIEDLVCDTNVFNEANKDTESVERTYLLTLEKVDRQCILFNTVERDTNDSLSAVEEYSDTNNSGIAKSEILNKSDVYYQCYKCGHMAESKFQLTLHLNRHTPNRLEIISKKSTKNCKNLFCYRCSLCNYLTEYKCLFNFHNRTHLTKKNYRHILQNKNVPTKAFASNLKVNKIYMKHDKAKYINHHYNRYNFGSRSKYIESSQNFSRHDTSKSNMKIVVAEKQFNCSICEYRSNQNKHLKSHMQIHAQEKPFACCVCKYQASRKAHLKRHMRTHTGETPFACCVCKYQASRKAHLKQHMRTHTGEKPFLCSICKFQCGRKYNLKEHMQTHTVEKPFSCSLCECQFRSKKSFKLHMRSHTGDKPFSCSVCEYRCSYNQSLKRHMRTHTGEKPFLCSICKHQFRYKQNLKQHMQTHTGEKPFSCSVCEYQCSQKQNLKRHIRTHTGEKPFACSVCEYRCSYKQSLQKHLRIHTGEKPFSCSVCEYQSSHKQNLKTHMGTHIGKKIILVQHTPS